MKDPRAWEIVYNFMTTEMQLPEAHDNLKTVLGTRFIPEKWSPILNVVLSAENNVAEALKRLDEVANQLVGC